MFSESRNNQQHRMGNRQSPHQRTPIATRIGNNATEIRDNAAGTGDNTTWIGDNATKVIPC